MTNNTLERNVIVLQDGASLVLAGRPGVLRPQILSVQNNLYFAPGRALSPSSPRFGLSWQRLLTD